MTKNITFRSEARERLLRGATTLVDAVRVTLGPKSKSVLLEKRWGRPLICNDGVTIAKEIELASPEENLGAQVIREAAEKTGTEVGDGTSTATILAHAIFAEGLRNVAAGASPIELKKGLEHGLAVARVALKELSRPVVSRREKAQIATISAHNDGAIGEIVADAMERIGVEGVVSVEDSRTTDTSLEVVEGMQFDRGYISPYFITDPQAMRVVLKDALLLISERKIANMTELVPLLEAVVKLGQPLLVIAEEVEGEALATLVVNRIRGLLSCAAVKAPGFGERRQAMLQDIAILTGGKLVSEELGSKLESLTVADLGRVSTVLIDRDTTTLIGGTETKEAVFNRCRDPRTQLSQATTPYEKERINERLAKLTGGVAVIRVGAPTETELNSRKEAFEDAISATKAAVAEGIVPGGGLALIRIADRLAAEESKRVGDERTGVQILRHALEAPTRQIAENSLFDPGVVVNEMRRGEGSYGFDAARGVYCDLTEAGIIDPAKVVRVALENAVSVASTLLLTEATMTEVPESRDEEEERRGEAHHPGA